MKFGLVSAIFFTSVLFCVVNANDTDQKKYLHFGDACEPHLKAESAICDPHSNLVCNVKACMCKDHYVYDKNREICLGGEGAACIPPKTVSEESPCAYNLTCEADLTYLEKVGTPDTLTKILNKLQKYPGGQTLNPVLPNPFICKCPKGFEVATVKKKLTCRPTLGFGHTCPKTAKKEDSRCDPNVGLICANNQTCTCRTPDLYFSKGVERCVSPIGSKCNFPTTPSTCGKNAICSSHFHQIEQQLVMRKLLAATSVDSDQFTCMCAPGFTPNTAGECVGGYEVTCNKNSDCHADRFLTCVNGACRCQHPIGMSYSIADKKCKIHVGYPCVEKSGPRCVENSVCNKDHCQCKDGFTETSDGRCLLGHGSKCTIVVDDEGTRCNYYRGLACTGSTCECLDPTLKWNPKVKLCEAKEGNFCGKITFRRLPALEKDPFYPFGISNSTGISYFVGCEDGLACVKGQTERDLYQCQKHK